jgi:hypothetical protein
MKTNYTLCDFKMCPLKETCARFLYDLNRSNTTHFATMPYKEDRKSCRFYEPFDPNDIEEINKIITNA